MFSSTIHQATAFTLAAVVTAGLLGSVDLLATARPQAPTQIAVAAQAPAQVIVITGRRLARS